MIRQLRLHNFKCFEDQTLDLGALTLLSGLNGMGKSTVIQSLLLLRQSYQQRLLPSKGLALNGDLVRLGTTRDVLFEGAVSNEISFYLDLDEESSEGCHIGGVQWSFRVDQEADVLILDQAKSGPEKDLRCDAALSGKSEEFYESSLFQDAFHYLQAERIGPRTSFAISDFQVRQHRQLGTQGEYTAYFLALFGNEDILNPQLQHPAAMSHSLKNQVEAWMGEVSPGTRLSLNSVPDMDMVGLRFSFVTGRQESNAYRTTNVGFGLTYTLPVLVAILASAPGTLVLIENPEAHLHPRGQALVGELLAHAAQAGVQVVIETHSDHVLNGIRLAVHGGKISHENVQLHFFERVEQDDQSYHQVVSPRIDRNGRIDQWPEGFFDEWDKSLEALLEPRSDEG